MRERASRSSGSNAHRTPRDAFRCIDGRTATAGACACAPRIAALTGAGFSAESGVPTFRDARIGLWAQFDPRELAAPATFARNSLFAAFTWRCPWHRPLPPAAAATRIRSAAAANRRPGTRRRAAIPTRRPGQEQLGVAVRRRSAPISAPQGADQRRLEAPAAPDHAADQQAEPGHRPLPGVGPSAPVAAQCKDVLLQQCRRRALRRHRRARHQRDARKQAAQLGGDPAPVGSAEKAAP